MTTNGFFGTSNISFEKKTRLENIKFSNMGRNEISQNTIQRFLNFNYNEGLLMEFIENKISNIFKTKNFL